MKRLSYFIIAAAVLFFGACDSQNLEQNPVESIPVDQPVLTTITAGFESSDTKSVLSVSGSTGNVLWKSGDVFAMYSLNSAGYYFGPEFFYTSFSGDPKAKADFDGTAPSPLDYYLAGYPASAFDGVFVIGGMPYAFGILPKNQVATTNSFDPAANLAFAYSPTASGFEQLTFRNVATLLKVRVSGSKTSKLTTIRVQDGDLDMAGLVGVTGFDSELQLSTGWASDANSTSVSLKGSFTSGKDYYIAVIPGTYEGLSVTFIFDDGSFISKTLNQSVTFKRSTVRNLGTFNLDEAEDNLTIYNTHTSGTKPVTICVIPDGYTSEQKALFLSRAGAGMDYFFNTEPYKSYRDYFNVYFIWTPSVEEGASITDGGGNIITKKNTAFGSRWGATSYKDMTADASTVFSFVAANCPEIVKGTLTVDEVAILVLINDERYGGIAHISSNGRTYCQTPFVDNGDPLHWSIPNTLAETNEVYTDTWPARSISSEELERLKTNTGDWKNILIHEFGGHSFGRLKDEYWGTGSFPATQGAVDGHSWSVKYGLNVSGYYATESVPWKELIDASATLAAKDARYTARLGRFQGGDTYMFNRWRSEEISCMIDNRPYFSTWQRKLIVERILFLANGTTSVSLSDFLAKDDIKDPVRDGDPSMPPVKSVMGPAKVMPLLPPPVVMDDPEPKKVPVRGTPIKK